MNDPFDLLASCGLLAPLCAGAMGITGGLLFVLGAFLPLAIIVSIGKGVWRLLGRGEG